MTTERSLFKASWQTKMLYERLRRGPANTLELQHDFPLIHVARQVWELRHWYGCAVRTTRLPNGVAIYQLEEAAA